MYDVEGLAIPGKKEIIIIKKRGSEEEREGMGENIKRQLNEGGQTGKRSI